MTKFTKQNVLNELGKWFWENEESELGVIADIIRDMDDSEIELNNNQKWLLKDIERMWANRKVLDLSCKVSAVWGTLNSDAIYKAHGKEIDEVVQVFLSQEESENHD